MASPIFTVKHVHIGRGSRSIRVVGAQLATSATIGAMKVGPFDVIEKVERLAKRDTWPDGIRPDIIFLPENTFSTNNRHFNELMGITAAKSGVRIGFGVKEDAEKPHKDRAYHIAIPNTSEQVLYKKDAAFDTERPYPGFMRLDLNGFSLFISICRDIQDLGVQKAIKNETESELFIVPVDCMYPGWELQYTEIMSKLIARGNMLFVNSAGHLNKGKKAYTLGGHSLLCSVHESNLAVTELSHEEGCIVVDVFKD